jgi:hypothetical protein
MAPAQRRIIPQQEWGEFFEGVSSDYQGLDATLELLAPDDQPVLLAFGQPLADIACDESVTVYLGDGVSHTIERVTGVSVERDADGLALVVTIEAAGGPPARLTLARPAVRAVGSPAGGSGGDDPAFVGGSAGASGGSTGAGSGHDARGVGDDYGPALTFGRSDDMGGVAGVGGGSFGDQDLSGRPSYDITADVYGGALNAIQDEADAPAMSGATPTSTAQGSTGAKIRHHQPDVIDGGGDQGVIDPTIDPIEGAQLDPANDERDPYVEGEVGAQAERDLDDIEGESPERRPPRRPHGRG